MTKPVKPLLFAVIILAATTSIAYILNLIDQIVHVALYDYGLQFSLDWAIPYWILLRIVQIFLGVIAASTVFSTIFAFREYAYTKKPSEKMAPIQKPRVVVPLPTHPVERPSAMPVAPSAAPTPTTPTISIPPALLPATTPAPSMHAPTSGPTSEALDISGLTKCFHCGKVFSQPLRMLDFQGNRPRIVNICPFCSEIIPSVPLRDDREQEKKFLFRKKNNHASKTVAPQH